MAPYPMNTELAGYILIGRPHGEYVDIGYTPKYVPTWREPEEHEIVKRNIRMGTTIRCAIAKHLLHIRENYPQIRIVYPPDPRLLDIRSKLEKIKA